MPNAEVNVNHKQKNSIVQKLQGLTMNSGMEIYRKPLVQSSFTIQMWLQFSVSLVRFLVVDFLLLCKKF